MMLIRWLDNKLYPGVNDNWDDELFRKSIVQYISESSIILDVGAGAGIVEHMNFRGLAKKVCGIDLDPRVLDNPYLDEAKITGGERIPYDDGVFDVVFSDNVLEHLDKPQKVFKEIARVLRPGGVFLFKTPNRYHYMPFIARITPHRFHGFINRLRGREVVDTFPTRYKANSRSQIHPLARSANLNVEIISLIEGRPEYTRICSPLYMLGIAYERLVNLFDFLSTFRILMVGVLSKPH